MTSCTANKKEDKLMKDYDRGPLGTLSQHVKKRKNQCCAVNTHVTILITTLSSHPGVGFSTRRMRASCIVEIKRGEVVDDCCVDFRDGNDLLVRPGLGFVEGDEHEVSSDGPSDALVGGVP